MKRKTPLAEYQRVLIAFLTRARFVIASFPMKYLGTEKNLSKDIAEQVISFQLSESFIRRKESFLDRVITHCIAVIKKLVKILTYLNFFGILKRFVEDLT